MKLKSIFIISPILLISLLIFLPPTLLLSQKLVHYDLYVKDTLVNYGGKEKRAIAVNGQIPMPTLHFTEGDIAEIVVHNQMKEPTALHWHGLYLPNKEDGVPYLTQMPIEPGSTYTYKFPLIQNGTHWYHSHQGLQEQIGMYGSFIIDKKKEDSTFRKGIDDLPSVPVIITDWTNLNPENVHRMLHNANDWFAIEKNSVQSYAEAIRDKHFSTKITNEWKRMLAMDVSDVYYDALLINGKKSSQLKSVDGKMLKAGDKVRLQISNGAASTYFWLRYAGGKITVVANDGNDVEPIEVDRLIIGVSETYDIVLTIPADNTSFEFQATSEDRINSTSLFIGNGIKQLINPLPKLKYFEGMKMMNGMMKMNGDMNDMGMNMSFQQMDMNIVMYPEITDSQSMKMDEEESMEGKMNAPSPAAKIQTLNYAMLKSPENTTLPLNVKIKEISMELTGNMNRYVWSMDNRVLAESDKILVNKGEILRIKMYNNSMMRHPMHLHGQDFRIVTMQGENAPLKNVLDIMPMETDVIEFQANTEGDWFFHCHILYHMMAGMNRVISTQPEEPNPNLPDKKWAYKKLQRESNSFHFMAMNDFATNGNDGNIMLQNTRWAFGSEWRLGYSDMHGYEVETHFGRYIGRMQWFMPFVGFDWRYRSHAHEEENLFKQASTKDHRAQFSLGFEYTLPMLVIFQAEILQKGYLRLQLFRDDIPISKRMRAAFMVNTDKEYMLGLHYIIARNFALSTHYDSDMGIGFGLMIKY